MKPTRFWLLALAAAAGLVAEPAAARTRPIKVPRDAVTVLDGSAFWRWFEISRSPVVPAAPDTPGAEAGTPKPLPGMYVNGPLPPAKWRTPGFDDRDWPRACGRDFRNLLFSKLHLGAVCLRGKFHCKDLSMVGWKPSLYVNATFRGGIVVYLNGSEIARAGLPTGPITPDTPADPYPDDLFLTDKGRPFIFPASTEHHRRVKAGDKDLIRRYRDRDRVLLPVKIGAEHLRKGVNVLAVELHRSPYHPSATSWWAQNRHGRWAPCNLLAFRLAVSGDAITPNVARPKSRQVWRPDGRGQMWTPSTQVWTVDRNDRITLHDYGEPNEPLHPIRLVGARNGEFAGQIAVGWDKPIKGLRAVASELKHEKADAVIPAGSVLVRHLNLVHYSYSAQYWYDQVTTVPPKVIKVDPRSRGATGALLVTVRVPRNAAPGAYTGKVTVSFDGLDPLDVPLHISVADWTLPDPHQYRAYAGIYQSPETLALHYKVPMWSEKHWALIEQSFRLLGHVGNDFVHIPIINRSQAGNDEGWVYWVKQADGTYDYGLSVFDRYAALIKKYLKTPDFICLHVFRSPVYDATPAMTRPHHVTERDAKTGKLTPLRVPDYGTQESLAFWKPVLLKIKDRLAKLGLEKAICLGVLIENRLPPTLTEFHSILPAAGWVKGCHAPATATRPIPMRGGSVLVLQEHAYAVSRVDPLHKLPIIWAPDRVGARFYRGNAERRDLQDYRILCERNLYFESRGFGRVALDYWPAQAGRGRSKSIYQRWPESSSAQRGVYTFRLGWPGPQGAEPTLRLEAIREGLQESEAAIFIGEAQARHAAKLGLQLATACRDLLQRRIEFSIEHTHQPWGPIFTHVNHYGWRNLNAELFARAAEVEKALAK